MAESEIMKEIQIAMSKLGHRVFRNNVGVFYTKDGRPVKAGLCNGSSDLIGFTSTGRVLAIEVKTEWGRLKAHQTNFLLAVQAAGGVGFCARSVEEATDKINMFMAKNFYSTK